MKEYVFNDYIKDNFKNIFQKKDKLLNISFSGLKKPEKYKSIIKNIVDISPRKSIPRQMRVNCAGIEYLSNKKNKSLLLSCEMGTGKTDMSIKMSLVKDYKSIFIMIPPHLINKWEEEIRLNFKKENEYKIIKLSSWEELIPYRNFNFKAQNVKYYFLLTSTKAKLSYPYKLHFDIRKKLIYQEYNGISYTEKINKYLCPDCGTLLYDDNDNYKYTRRKCLKCNAVLSSLDRSKSKNLQKRLSISEYIKKQFKRNIDLLIVDEIHEYKGGGTAIGLSLSQMACKSNKIIGLTGTIMNGYASSLFYILYRLKPSYMVNKLEIDYKSLQYFIEKYGGFKETVTFYEKKHSYGMSKKRENIQKKEIPIVSPSLLKILLNFTIFLKLSDIETKDNKLPNSYEKVILCEQDKWSENYFDYIKSLSAEAIKDFKLMGKLVNDSLSLLSLPFKPYNIMYLSYRLPYTKQQARELNIKTNKEKELLKILKNELTQGRKCLIYVHYSNLGVGERIKEIINNELPNYKNLFLSPLIKADKRDKYINDENPDILICNPELVKTGLDLIQFKTAIYHESLYNIITLRQSSKRIYRIGQKENVKIFHLCYKQTPQEVALSLIAKKVLASTSIDGTFKLSEELSNFNNKSIFQELTRKIISSSKVNENIDIDTLNKEKPTRDYDNFELYFLKLYDDITIPKPKIIIEPIKYKKIIAIKDKDKKSIAKNNTPAFEIFN